MTASNYTDEEGWRYGVRFTDGSVRHTWNGSTQRIQAMQELLACRRRWLNDGPKLRLVRRRGRLGEWEVTAESYVCPVCKAESWNPNDLEQGYCGRCHDYTGLPGPLGDLIRQSVADRKRGCKCRELPAAPGYEDDHHPMCPLFKEAADA